MEIKKNISLKPYNTFGISEVATSFIEAGTERDILDIASLPYNKFVLGGGSNILFTKPVDELVIFNKLKGITLLKENKDHIWVEVRSGEVWHEFVKYTLLKGWAGLENLSLIPGTVGAAPIQNIGAYGVEVKDSITNVCFLKWDDRCIYNYTNLDCEFGYRDSIFKRELKNKVFILSVTFKLNKYPVFHLEYGAIKQELEKSKVTQVTIQAIADAIIRIRTSKLPDPKEIGNAGSFYKNPTISIEIYQKLQKQYPAIPSYPINNKEVKVPAGWLIEQSGWKGFRNGDVGVHQQQALVLVNFEAAKGKEIMHLSNQIIADVNLKFGIKLETEVNIH